MTTNYTQTISLPPKIADLDTMADLLAVAGPQNWMLIDPQGRVWSGPDPMVLAAHANYKPLAVVRAAASLQETKNG